MSLLGKACSIEFRHGLAGGAGSVVASHGGVRSVETRYGAAV